MLANSVSAAHHMHKTSDIRHCECMSMASKEAETIHLGRCERSGTPQESRPRKVSETAVTKATLRHSELQDLLYSTCVHSHHVPSSSGQ